VDGGPFEIHCGEAVASNGKIHGALVAALQASLRGSA
jgi:hypothetical protein